MFLATWKHGLENKLMRLKSRDWDNVGISRREASNKVYFVRPFLLGAFVLRKESEIQDFMHPTYNINKNKSDRITFI